MNATAQEDKALLERISRSDTGAFDVLYDRHWKRLWQLAEKKTGDTNEAKDLVQELFIDIWNRRTRLVIKSSLQTYLVAALYLKVFRYFRTKGFKTTHYQHFENYLVQTGQNIEQVHIDRIREEAELGNMTDILEAAIAQMPEQMRKVFTLKHFHQYSNSEISDELGISVNTVKNHLKGGVHRLRKAGEASPYFPIFLLLWMI